MNKLHDRLLHFKPYNNIVEWSKTAIIPGFRNLPLYTVASFFFYELRKEAILNKASSLAYNFMLAIFPGIIFLFTLIPYIPIENFQENLLKFLELVIPIEAFAAIKSTLEDIIKNQNGGLLSFGFLLSTFFATNGMTNLMKAFNKSSLTKENRKWLKRRIIALLLYIAIIIALSVGIGIFAVIDFLVNYLKSNIHYDMSWLWTIILKIARWFILFLIYFVTIGIVYKYGPSKSRYWKIHSAGTFLATILAILTFSIFSFYINHFNSYNKLYGSISTIIVIMIWMYLNSLIILIGFELNTSIALSKPQTGGYRKKINNEFKKYDID